MYFFKKKKNNRVDKLYLNGSDPEIEQSAGDYRKLLVIINKNIHAV